MKKLMLILGLISSLAAAPTAQAGFFDSDYFEPTILCAGLGGAGYLTAGEGQELLFAGVGCGVGALVGILINQRYKNKYGKVYQEEIEDLKRAVREHEVIQAQKAASGDDENDYSTKIKEIVPGKRLPNGDVLAPTIREKLILPGEGTDIRIGQ